MQRILSAGIVLLLCLPALSQPAEALTFNEAISLARRSSPAIVAARLRIEEERGRMIGASRILSTNPSLELEAGRRSGEVSSTDYGIAIEQEITFPQRRDARIQVVRAAIAEQELTARATENAVLHDVATAFLRAVEAEERAAVARTTKGLVDEALVIAARRYAAGDVAQLDVNLARTAVARSVAELRAAEAAREVQATRLRIILGLEREISIDGSLRDDAFDPDAFAANAADRPSVRALEAEIAATEAERRLAGLQRWPDFAVHGSYENEEGSNVVLWGIGITLPIFDRGQEAVAITNARHARLVAERDALIRRIESELRSSAATVKALRQASTEYQRTVLPLVEENERLALESYEVGQIGLGDLLLVRREALEARRALIDQLIETRLAEVELRAQAGIWPRVNQ